MTLRNKIAKLIQAGLIIAVSGFAASALAGPSYDNGTWVGSYNFTMQGIETQLGPGATTPQTKNATISGLVLDGEGHVGHAEKTTDVVAPSYFVTGGIFSCEEKVNTEESSYTVSPNGQLNLHLVVYAPKMTDAGKPQPPLCFTVQRPIEGTVPMNGTKNGVAMGGFGTYITDANPNTPGGDQSDQTGMLTASGQFND